jgi:ABC-type multidrug transport system fused ATPase/permease subunit
MTGGIEVRDLTVRRGGRVVLRDLSFDAPRGRVLALVGASGAGKSTLLRCLNRLAEPDGGTIALDGEDIRHVAPQLLRRRVALVAQAPVMLPGTVADNLAYGIAALTDGARAAALAAAGLDTTFLPRLAKALSGGERARVALARALTRDPDAILLDEPTAALDPETAHVIAETVAALAQRDLAVIVATHDAALAEAVAHATLRLGSGAASIAAGAAAAGDASGAAASGAGGAAASGAGGAAAGDASLAADADSDADADAAPRRREAGA